MNKDNIIKAREILKKELDESMKQELGSIPFSKLCDLIGRLDLLISILDDPVKFEKRQKLI